MSSTFDRAANNPGAFQDIMNRLDKTPEVEPPAVNRSGGTDADRKKWKVFLTADLRNAPPASDAVRETHSSPKHLQRIHLAKINVPPLLQILSILMRTKTCTQKKIKVSWRAQQA